MPLSLDGATRVHYIVGDPIAQVKSPGGVSACLQERGHNAVVLPAHVSPTDLATWVAGVSLAHNVDGIIVTVPHKFACRALCRSVSERSAFVGSVNTMRRNADGSWHAGSGALFDLASHALRPRGHTSADAAGLPILPGLVRYDEVASGEIAHALRFTAPRTRGEWTWPARHEASNLSGPQYPPMGQRFRLKSSVDPSGFPASVRPIIVALKTYGMMLADNGSAWYLSGAPDPRWNDDELHALASLYGADFEAVDVSSLQVEPDSGAARMPDAGPAVRIAVEFHRAGVDHYFVTADAGEIAALDTGAHAGWARTGEAFAVHAPGSREGERPSPVCRYYGRPEAGLDSHFYSASPAECRALAERAAGAWMLESDEVFVVALPDTTDGSCPAGSVPVYRLFNARTDVNHRYTTSVQTRQRMIGQGWFPEGYGPDAVAMCAFTPP